MFHTDSSESENLSSQVRTNALTSYFFLGFLYLLAYRNPNFRHPFIRAHAWSATRIHLGFLGFLVLYKLLLSRLLAYPIPLLNVSFSRVVFTAVLLYLLALLLRGAYLAYQGEKFKGFGLSFATDAMPDIENEKVVGEANIARTLLSFLPGIGVFVAERFPTPLTAVGARVSGYGTSLLVLEYIFLRGDNLFMVTLFFLIVLIVTTGVFLVAGKSVGFLAPVQMLPGIRDIQLYFKTVPSYVKDVFLVAIGRKEELSFLLKREEMRARTLRTEAGLEAYFTETNQVFSPYLIYVPILNIIFIYRFFSPQKNRYALAINQGIILTLLVVIIGYFTYPDTSLLLLVILPMMLGLATVKGKPFLQIPILYEISSLVSYITFGIVSGTKSTREKSKEVREVRLKVE
jgi:hypothetical protein